MKLWFTAQEFADLAEAGKMPGLPSTKRGMNALIAREGWEGQPGLCRKRSGRTGGGGDEFHLDLAPLATRLAYARSFVSISASDFRATITEDGLSAKARAARDARLCLLSLADRFRTDNHLSVIAADDLFSGLFNAGSMEVPAWVTAEVEHLSARSLARWRARRDGADGPLGHDPSASRKGTGVLDRAADGAVKTLVIAAIAKQPFLRAKDIHALVSERFGAEITVPPLRTFQHALKQWRADYANELKYLSDPDGYRSGIEFSAVNATRAERLNQLWQIDASPADVMLKEGRHSVYVAIDIHSRQVTVLVSKTPRASAVGLLMRKCIIAWGVPETVKTDNGSDFTAGATERLMAGLGITVDRSPVYDPKTKGNVERAIGTFQRDLCVLPGFVGHSVADRKVIENRKAFAKRLGTDERELFGVDMDFADFQCWCDVWAGQIYASTPHEGLGRRTPFEVASAYAGRVRRIEDVRALDILLAPVAGKDGLRLVTKTGIRIDGEAYYTHAAMPGDQVFCRMDPADLGRLLVFAPDGETFLGEAVCPELAGLDPVETISKVKAAQKGHYDGRVKDIRKEMRRIGPRDVADAVRGQAKRRAGTLIAFPRPADTHQTAALGAAGVAARPQAAPALGGKAAEIHAQMLAADATSRPVGPTPSVGSADISPARGETKPGNVTALRKNTLETREERFARARRLEDEMAAGGTPGADDLLWLGGYRSGSEYFAMRTLFDEFGEAMGL